MSPIPVAVALFEPARVGFVEVENATGADLYLWVAVDGFWPPVAREESRLMVAGARQRFGPGARFEALAQTAREGDDACGSPLEELVPSAVYSIVAQRGALGFVPTGARPADLAPRGGEPVGEILLARQVISQEDLNEALTVQLGQKRPLGEILVELGILSERKLRENISEQLGIPFLQLTQQFADPDVVRTVAGKFCKDNRVLPLYRIRDRLVVAMVDPTDLEAIDGLQFLTGYKVDPVLCASEDFQATLDHFHTLSSPAEHGANRDAKGDQSLDLSEASLMDQTPIVRLVSLLLKQALLEGASDIHLDLEEAGLRVHNCVRGALLERDAIPRLYSQSCVARIKMLGELDVDEHRSPQDGQFSVVHEGRRVDVRVSTIPTEKLILSLSMHPR